MPNLPFDSLRATTYVPLSGDCRVTTQLRRYQLRTEAYPLDWVLITYEEILRALQNRFEGWSDQLFLGPLRKQKQDLGDGVSLSSQKMLHAVYGGVYHYILPHDFPDQTEETRNLVQEKYQRRIDRLYQQLEDSDYLVFVVDSEPINEGKMRGFYSRIRSCHPELPTIPPISFPSPEIFPPLLEKWLDETYPELNYTILTDRQLAKKLGRKYP